MAAAARWVKRLCLLLLPCLLLACSRPSRQMEIDRLNEQAYAWHYRNLDSTRVLAEHAYEASAHYAAGKAEALNHLAFVDIAHMDYSAASARLAEAVRLTGNQVELLVSYVQQMRLCQRQSRNKDFYDYRQRAEACMRRIEEEQDALSDHEHRRYVYARTEYGIVASAYFYYVGLVQPFVESLEAIAPVVEASRDTAQLLNFYYNIGAGGVLSEPTPEQTAQSEFDYLMHCYMLAKQAELPYWEANSMQAISEHLQSSPTAAYLLRENVAAMHFINVDNMPDSLLAGNLAQRALDTFTAYGDVYQVAGAYRTLAECYWLLGDYQSSLICLNDALYKDTAINRAPDLVASIREQLSLTHSALNNKPQSDYNRNLYLDMHERTRQDRKLEARADQLERSTAQLNWMMVAVFVMVVLVTAFLLYLYYQHRRNGQGHLAEGLIEALAVWRKSEERAREAREDEQEEMSEQRLLALQHVQREKIAHLEQRTKVSLVVSIAPLIDRMRREVAVLSTKKESEEVRAARYEYITELADKINSDNAVLTEWIQMRQGQLRLHIESFPLQPLFDMLEKGRMAFQLKGLAFSCEPTGAVVKGDKTLTLFMLNTIADNARKFTPAGGHVVVSSTQGDGFVEISVVDDGKGMTAEQQERLFSSQAYVPAGVEAEGQPSGSRPSHGFGLMNCKGIIEKYKKLSSIFSVCTIGVESELGKGSRFFFRLPNGVMRLLVLGLLVGKGLWSWAAAPAKDFLLGQASNYADSAYYMNVAGHYSRTLDFADSCRMCLNRYVRQVRPGSKEQMKAYAENVAAAAELRWFRDSLPLDYMVILDVRNEAAVAALALHRWDLYHYNNNVYNRLFRECSADRTLASYVDMMQKSEANKNVAVVVLFLLLMMMVPACYFLYYRYRLHDRLSIEKEERIKAVLLSGVPTKEKLQQIRTLWTGSSGRLGPVVDQVVQALEQEVGQEESHRTQMEMAGDDLRRAQYEEERLYVVNSVLDNCLSTLKHETMYYPSRIRQLVEGRDENLSAMRQLLGYYKELYDILSLQAMRQLSDTVKVDAYVVAYLFELLRKLGGEKQLQMEEVPSQAPYQTVFVRLPRVRLTAQQCVELFTPSTVDVRYLLCRQIVRDVGEATNARGCGIQAVSKEEQGIIIEITLTARIWKNLKLLS